MTDQTTTTPGPEPESPRRFTRSGSDRVVAGVAGGLGRYFGVDPILFRVAFVVLAFAGGAGVLAYLGLMIAVPSDAAPGEPRRSRTAVVAGAVVVGLAALVLLPGPFFFAPVLVVIAAVLAAVALARDGTLGGDDPTQRLVRVIIIAGAVLLALGLGVVAAFGVAMGGGVAVAVAIVALGVALVVAAFAGGARWLIVPALVLVGPAMFVTAAGIEFRGGFGERAHRPASVSEVRQNYELGAGKMVVDLRDVRFPAGTTPVRIDMGMGETRILVPHGVCVDSDVRIGVGMIDVLGHKSGGFDRVHEARAATMPGTPRILLEGEIGMGALKADTGDWDFRGPEPWGWGDDEDATRDSLCTEA